MASTTKGKKVATKKKQVSKTSTTSVRKFLSQKKKKGAKDRPSSSSNSRSQTSQHDSSGSENSDDASRSKFVFRMVSQKRRKTWKPMSESSIKLVSNLMDSAQMSVIRDVRKSERQEFQQEWDSFKMRFRRRLKDELAPSSKTDYDCLQEMCSTSEKTLDELVQLIGPLEESLKEHEQNIEEKEQQLVDLQQRIDSENDSEYEVHPFLKEIL